MTQTPPSLETAHAESQNTATQDRVLMAICQAAQNIASEDPNTPSHTPRVRLATEVARQPGAYIIPFTTLVCAEGITSASTDADIGNMVSAVWNTVAGA